MYVAIVANRNSPPAVLLRESLRRHGKTCNRTISNLSHWPSHQIESLRQALKGDYSKMPALASSFDIVRSRPHGHVAAVLATTERLGLETVLSPEFCRRRSALAALIAARILKPSFETRHQPRAARRNLPQQSGGGASVGRGQRR